MAARLDAIARASIYTNPYAGSVRARELRTVPPPSAPRDLMRYRSEIARFLLYAGKSEEAAETLEDVLTQSLAEPGVSPTFVSAVQQLLALSHLRVATQRNCAAGAATRRCSAPMRRTGIHPDERPARRAIELYEGILRDPPDESTALDSRWLLNLAYMTLGDYPFEVPEPWLVPPTAFRSDYDVRTFPDVAPGSGSTLPAARAVRSWTTSTATATSTSSRRPRVCSPSPRARIPPSSGTSGTTAMAASPTGPRRPASRGSSAA